jgi:hypothetical protein
MTIQALTVSVETSFNTVNAEAGPESLPSNIQAFPPLSIEIKDTSSRLNNPLDAIINNKEIQINQGVWNNLNQNVPQFNNKIDIIDGTDTTILAKYPPKAIPIENGTWNTGFAIKNADININVGNTTNTLETKITNSKIPIHDASTFNFLGSSVNVNYAFIRADFSIADASNPMFNQSFTTPGTYSWTAPAGVTSVSVVAVGSGGTGGHQWSSGGGGGGGLGYKNNISVTPGQSYTVEVGAAGPTLVSNATSSTAMGNNSYFISDTTVCGFGAGRGGTDSTGSGNGGYGGGYTGDGGGRGGNAGYQGTWTRSGGGAGGYSGQGADGGDGDAGQGGGGGAGQHYSSTWGSPGGGGVGLFGEGTSGAASTTTGEGGKGGSGGGDGDDGEPLSNNKISKGDIAGGEFGGGGGGSGTSAGGGPGGGGAVRLVWTTGSNTIEFPSTNVGSVLSASFSQTNLDPTPTFSGTLNTRNSFDRVIKNQNVSTIKSPTLFNSSYGGINNTELKIVDNTDTTIEKTLTNKKISIENPPSDSNGSFITSKNNTGININPITKAPVEIPISSTYIGTQADKASLSPSFCNAVQLVIFTSNQTPLGYFERDGHGYFETITPQNDPRIGSGNSGGDDGDAGGGGGGVGSGPIQSWS